MILQLHASTQLDDFTSRQRLFRFNPTRFRHIFVPSMFLFKTAEAYCLSLTIAGFCMLQESISLSTGVHHLFLKVLDFRHYKLKPAS